MTFNQNLIDLAIVHLTLPRSPDKDSPYFVSLRRLTDACLEAGVDHHDVMREACDILNERKVALREDEDFTVESRKSGRRPQTPEEDAEDIAYVQKNLMDIISRHRQR